MNKRIDCCAKCGSNIVRKTYEHRVDRMVNQDPNGPKWIDTESEWLGVECRDCGYQWKNPCLDAGEAS